MSATPAPSSKGMSTTTNLIIGGIIAALLLGGGILLYFLTKKGKCSDSKDCKDSAKPNCVKKKCVATDVCSSDCKGDTPHCVNNVCVGCKTYDDCKGNTGSGKTTCSSSGFCVAPTPAITALIGKYQNKLVVCSGKVHLVENGTRRWIIDPESYTRWRSSHPTVPGEITLNAEECITLLAMNDGGNIS